jgi:hypothetical protein
MYTYCRLMQASPEDFTFKKSTSFRHPESIYNVVPGDFTHDGKLDLLVMSQGTRQSQLAISLYIALPEGGFGTHALHSFSFRLFIVHIKT